MIHILKGVGCGQQAGSGRVVMSHGGHHVNAYAFSGGFGGCDD